MGKEIIFYYDVICPYAYLASKLIADVAKRNNAVLRWRPVLLGGIYKRTKKEGSVVPDNKMILTYADQKRKIMGQDLAMQLSRYNIEINRASVPHHIRTLNALRVILSTADETCEQRVLLTHKLYDALWIHQQDISNIGVLQDIVDSLSYKLDVRSFLDNQENKVRVQLMKNTDEAINRGAYGVPCFWVNNRMYFGGDRLFMVERALGNTSCTPHRLFTKPSKLNTSAKLTVYFDFSSPWAYLGIKQLPRLLKSLDNIHVDVEYVPILLGALFKDIGSPVVPLAAMGENKRNYYQQDYQDFLQYLKIKNFQFSTHFPLRTVLACRIAAMKPEYKLIEAIYDGAWKEDKNIADNDVLQEILDRHGYNGNQLLQDATRDQIKLLLRKNNQRALNEGVCGVPSFQINAGGVIFGQDRLNVVADQLLGWTFQLPIDKHKL